MKTSEKQKNTAHLKVKEEPDLLSDWTPEELRLAWEKGLEGEPLSIRSAEEHRRYFASKKA